MYNNLNINDFDYNLPDDKIAKHPLKERDKSLLLHFDGKNISKNIFSELPQLLDKEDFLVYNNTKVIQARLIFRKSTGAAIEIFCLEPHEPADYQSSFQTTQSCIWEVMVGNLKRWKNEILTINLNIENKICVFSAKYLGKYNNMSSIVEFSWNNSKITFDEILQNLGKLPIPPYLNRETEENDKTAYQTTYAKTLGSVAAPTAGLHFTPQILEKIAEIGIKSVEITLHVGAGTFQPVKDNEVIKHEMHSENFMVELSVLEQIIKKINSIVAVGTTSVRTLESLYYLGHHIKENPQNPDLLVSQWEAYENNFSLTTEESLKEIVKYLKTNNLSCLFAKTKIMIIPTFKFRIVKKIITNFHQPKSTLLLLVSAFTSDKNRKKIYDFALKNNFRFLSYGDSSLLERDN